MDQGENLSQQYWVDRGHLVVKGGIDYSAKSVDTTVTQDHKNIYALPKLERCVYCSLQCVWKIFMCGVFYMFCMQRMK